MSAAGRQWGFAAQLVDLSGNQLTLNLSSFTAAKSLLKKPDGVKVG